MTLTAMGRGVCNVDEFRRAIERIPPAKLPCRELLREMAQRARGAAGRKGRGHSRGNLQWTRRRARARHAAQSARGDSGGVESFDNSAIKLRFNKSFRPGFKIGDRVVARNFNPAHHTRLPRYARGKRGMIRYDQGVFVFPDTHAHGQGGKPQHVYTVAFEAARAVGPRR